MKVLWICGLPESVRVQAPSMPLTEVVMPAWSWVLGHLPPPKDIELHIICPVLGLRLPRIDFEYQGAYWHCFRQKKFEIVFLWVRFFFAIRTFVKELKPDVVHGWGGETGCGWLATLISCCAVVSVQGLLAMLYRPQAALKWRMQRRDLRAWLLRFCERGTYRRAKVLLVESEASRQGLKTYYGHEGVYVPHPLRDEFLRYDIIKHSSFPCLDAIKFVYIGNLIRRKGAIDAVEAFSTIPDKKASLVMIGDGAERVFIQSLISQLGLEGRVILRGSISAREIINEFKDAQFFLLPSYGDTGPTALKEALACGLYPICYKNSGPQDLITHYECGRLVETADVRTLSIVLNQCVLNREDCVKNATRAALRVREELSPTRVWIELTKTYLTITKKTN